jgi:hypothetical protein
MSGARRRFGIDRVVLAGMASAMVSMAGRAQSPPPNKHQTPRTVIDTVRVQRENVFDRSEESSNWLARAANNLHIVTRERVIERELLIKPGERFDSAAAAESARNLRKLGIFRNVTVDSTRADTMLVASVTTRDAWTTQPYTTFKTSGDQITWGIGVTEKNLLGSQILATVRYISDPDRSTTHFSTKLPRLLANRLGIGVMYEQLSDGQKSQLKVAAPFTSLAGRSSFTLDLQYRDESILQFFEGQEEARDTLRHLMTKGTMSVGWAPRASPIGFIRIGTTLQARREDYSPTAVAEEDRTFFGELEVSLEASRSKFSEVQGFRTLGGQEDVDLSNTVRVSLWLAPAGWGYDRFGIGPSFKAQVGKTFPKGFVKAAVRSAGLFTNQGLDSGSVVIGGLVSLKPIARHALVVNADIGWLKDPYPGEEFDLGFSFGPRGFPAHAFTGDRAFFATAEYRYVIIENLGGLVAIGAAGFADYGGAWYSGSPRRSGTDVGVGLRLGSTRSSSGGAAARIDFARRFANDVLPAGWVLAVGSGFAFDRPR